MKNSYAVLLRFAQSAAAIGLSIILGPVISALDDFRSVFRLLPYWVFSSIESSAYRIRSPSTFAGRCGLKHHVQTVLGYLPQRSVFSGGSLVYGHIWLFSFSNEDSLLAAYAVRRAFAWCALLQSFCPGTLVRCVI